MKSSSEDQANDATGSTEQRKCPRQQRWGKMQEMVAKTKSILLLIPPVGCSGRAFSKFLLQQGKENVWILGIWDTSTTMGTPGTQLRHHPTADTPQGCQVWINV